MMLNANAMTPTSKETTAKITQFDSTNLPFLSESTQAVIFPSTTMANYTYMNSTRTASTDKNGDDLIYIVCGTVLAVITFTAVIVVICVLRKRRKNRGLVKPRKDYPVGSFVKRKSDSSAFTNIDIAATKSSITESSEGQNSLYQNFKNENLSPSHHGQYVNAPSVVNENLKDRSLDHDCYYLNGQEIESGYVNIGFEEQDNSSVHTRASLQSPSNEAITHEGPLSNRESPGEMKHQDMYSSCSTASTIPCIATDDDMGNPFLETSCSNYFTNHSKEGSESSSIYCLEKNPNDTQRSETITSTNVQNGDPKCHLANVENKNDSSVYFILEKEEEASNGANNDDVITSSKNVLNGDPEDHLENLENMNDGSVYFILEKEDELLDPDDEGTEPSQSNSESKSEKRNSDTDICREDNSHLYIDLQDEHDYESYSFEENRSPRKSDQINDTDGRQNISGQVKKKKYSLI